MDMHDTATAKLEYVSSVLDFVVANVSLNDAFVIAVRLKKHHLTIGSDSTQTHEEGNHLESALVHSFHHPISSALRAVCGIKQCNLPPTRFISCPLLASSK